MSRSTNTNPVLLAARRARRDLLRCVVASLLRRVVCAPDDGFTDGSATTGRAATPAGACRGGVARRGAPAPAQRRPGHGGGSAGGRGGDRAQWRRRPGWVRAPEQRGERWGRGGRGVCER